MKNEQERLYARHKTRSTLADSVRTPISLNRDRIGPTALSEPSKRRHCKTQRTRRRLKLNRTELHFPNVLPPKKRLSVWRGPRHNRPRRLFPNSNGKPIHQHYGGRSQKPRRPEHSENNVDRRRRVCQRPQPQHSPNPTIPLGLQNLHLNIQRELKKFVLGARRNRTIQGICQWTSNDGKRAIHLFCSYYWLNPYGARLLRNPSVNFLILG